MERVHHSKIAHGYPKNFKRYHSNYLINSYYSYPTCSLMRRWKLFLAFSVLFLFLTWLLLLQRDDLYSSELPRAGDSAWKSNSWSHNTNLQIKKGSDLKYYPKLPLSWTKNKPLTNHCPQVFIIGARKGGTTSLYHYLSSHPHFRGIRLDWGPVAGETWWFSQEYDPRKLSEYLKLFSHEEGFMTGEATVDYLVNCNVPSRLRKTCGLEAKIIILLRDPALRFISDYYMRLDINMRRYYPGAIFNSSATLSQTIESEYEKFLSKAPKRIASSVQSLSGSDWNDLKCLFREGENLFYEGLYYVHIRNWLSNYPPSNILLVPSQSLFRDTVATVAMVMEFVGLERLSVRELESITSSVYNYGSYNHSNLSKTDLNRLHELYEPFNKFLLK